MTTIHHIYDKVFKKILTLSSTAVINLINGLFDTDYPTDSHITYNWTEFENNELRRVLADTVLTINHAYSYHMEAQMTDESLMLDIDIIEKEHEAELMQREQIISEKDDIISAKDAEIALLKAELEALKAPK